PHPVGVRLGANLLVDADAIEDVGDFSETDDLFAGFVRALDDRLAGRSHGEVLAIRRSLEVTAPGADKRQRDDASDVVLAPHQLPRDRADLPQLLNRNDLL